MKPLDSQEQDGRPSIHFRMARASTVGHIVSHHFVDGVAIRTFLDTVAILSQWEGDAIRCNGTVWAS